MGAVMTEPTPTRVLASESGFNPAASQRLVLGDLTWDAYVAISDAIPDRPAVRMTYDTGSLQIMTTSATDEIQKSWLSRFIEIMLEECSLPYARAGSTTFRRKEMEKGLEPDDCFWIENEPRMRGRLDYDIAKDPPPDLLLEIEVTRSALNRMGIYASFGVQEAWRFDGQKLHVHRLKPDSTYEELERSPTLPRIDVQSIVAFLKPDPTNDFTTLCREVRAWVRAQLTPPAA
jgi:Uma2 family endonuclease